MKTVQKAVRMTPEMVKQIAHLARSWSLTAEPLTPVAVIREAVDRAYLMDQAMGKKSAKSHQHA